MFFVWIDSLMCRLDNFFTPSAAAVAKCQMRRAAVEALRAKKWEEEYLLLAECHAAQAEMFEKRIARLKDLT